MSAILARLFSDLDIAVLERAKDGTFSLLSETPPWLQTLWPAIGTTKEGLQPGDTFYFLEDFLERNEDFWQSPSNDQRSSGVWTENTPDGKEQLLEATATYIEDTPLLLIKIPHHQQVWPIYQQAREQRLEYEQLIDEINKREVLLHCIVHDLSNPLASIKGSLNLLQSEDMVESDGGELLRIGLRQADKMQNLIRSILTTFANEVRPLVPTLIGTDIAPDLGSCAQEVVKSLQATASLKGVSVELTETATATPFKVVGEAERLERVLYNLLANAVRHSSSGQTVTVNVFDDGEFIHADVMDQGAGVPDNLIDGLFDRFSQGKDKSGQVGLGLYFCKITVEGWGGTIGYAHGASGGARFWFRLPKPVEHEDTTPEIQHT